MFSKISRYRKLPDTVTLDAEGRRLESKSLRLLPEVSGTFLHVVEERDRLDHLAHKYYRQPRKWWRICDANAEFLVPQDLLGKEPIVTDRFSVSFTEGAQPPWANLLRNLSNLVGVEDAKFIEDIQLVEKKQTLGRQEVTVHVERFERSVIVTYNRLNVSAEDLANEMTNFQARRQENIGRVGKKIIIPPDIVG